MTSKLTDYDFILPESLIATEPVVPRDSSNLLIYKDSKIVDTIFRNIVNFIPSNTVFVLNDSKVAKARLKFKVNEKNVEVFFISNLENNLIHVLCSPGKIFKKSFKFYLPGNFGAEVVNILDDGSRILKVNGIDDIYSYLELFGETPLPPYIKTDNPNNFSEQYQTVYANNYGSVAAPTAGLHFTSSLIQALKERGCQFLYVTLNVGLGTFMPVRVVDIESHKMHSEFFSVSTKVANLLNSSVVNNLPLISVGTTSLRVLQSSFDHKTSKFVAGSASTDIFIYPGFNKFVVDALITNFHLPKSTLFMLVSAIVGLDEAKRIYKHAINNRYRFYSFGDASLIWL